MDQYRINLQHALDLAGEGKFKEGLKLLESTLDEAIAARRLRLVPTLASNAALLCEFMCDFESAVRYAKLARRYSSPDSTLAPLQLGRLYAMSGAKERARYWYNRCRKISISKGDAATLELLARLSSRLDNSD